MNKTATQKQKRWRIRNFILWRLRGMCMPLSNMPGVLTLLEREKLTQAFSLIKEVIDTSTQSSINLGYNAKPRCSSCGKPLNNEGYCINKKCYKSNERH